MIPGLLRNKRVGMPLRTGIDGDFADQGGGR